jgi:hypothetical protein
MSSSSGFTSVPLVYILTSQALTLSKSSLDIASGREHATLLIKTLADTANSYDTHALTRRVTDYGDGYDTYALTRRIVDTANSYDTHALTRRVTDYGDGYDAYKLGGALILLRDREDSAVTKETVILLRYGEDCVVTRAIYGGLRICYKREGDPLDFETLFYILLTLRRIDEFIQDIAQID